MAREPYRDRDYEGRPGGPYGYRTRGAGGGMDWLWWVLGLIGLVVLAIILIPMFFADDPVAPTAPGVGVEEVEPGVGVEPVEPGVAPGAAGAGIQGATIEVITDNPQAWVGRQVVVSGEFNEMVGANAFTLENDELLFDDELLVVSGQPIQAPQGLDRQAATPFVEDDVLQATGTVRMFNLAEIEQELGVDLDDQLFADFEGRPAVVAQNISFVARGGEVAEPAQVAPGATIITPEQLGQPQQLAGMVGETVRLETMQVLEVIGDNAFWVGAGQDQRLLVVEPEAAPAGQPLPDVNQGQRLTVVGDLMQAQNIEQLRQQLGLNDQVVQALREQPVFLRAQNIQVANQ